MKIFDVNQEARGFVAIGQMATGFIAVGQVATGFVAIGQGARGVFALGQGAIGVVAVGMGAVGLVYTVAMVGAGGRGLGLVVPLVPSLGPRHAVPPVDGKLWIDVERDEAGDLGADGEVLRADLRLKDAIAAAAPGTYRAAVRREKRGLVVTRLLRVPKSRLKDLRFWLGVWPAQLVLLAIAAMVVWALAIQPVVDFVLRG